MRRTHRTIALFAAFVVTAPTVAAAQTEAVVHANAEHITESPGPEIAHDPPSEAPGDLSWDGRRSSVLDGVLTGVAAAGTIAITLALPSPEVPRWKGPVLVDGPVRSALRLGTPQARSTASAVSDVLLGALITWTVVDAAIAWGVHGSLETAIEMSAINLESYSLTLLVTQLFKRVVARQRPRDLECTESGECEYQSSENVSFASGHTAMAFTAAGLLCAHHENLPLYGSDAGGIVACATATTAATTVGVLRMVSDAHYLTDVLAGAAIGFLSGYVLADLLRYELGEPDPTTQAPSIGTLSPLLSPQVAGLSLSRVW